MSAVQVHHFLRPFQDDLYSADENVRSKASEALHLAIDEQLQHLPAAAFTGLVARLNESGLALLSSTDTRDRLAGLTLLDCLLDINDDTMQERRIETANQLRKVVENDKQPSYDPELLRAAAKSLGHLARVASTTEIEFLQTFSEKHVFKWLNDQRYEMRRFAAILIVRELAINAPSLIFSKWKLSGVGKPSDNLLQCMFNVVFDSKALLREAAREALMANLKLISEREYTDEHLRQALSQLDGGFAQLSVEKSHGAMLVLDVLLTVPSSHDLNNTMRNMQRDFQDVVWEVLQRREHRDRLVRQKVLDLIPKMAAFLAKVFLQPNKYTQPNNFLTVSILHLLQVIKQGSDRQLAYTSLGQLFLAMASVLTKFRALIDDIISAIKQGFGNPFCTEALTCLGMIVRVSEVSRSYVDRNFLDNMFKGGLTSTLIETLQIIVDVIPSTKREVQERLRNYITKGLLDRFVASDEPLTPLSPRSLKGVPRTVGSRLRGTGNLFGRPSMNPRVSDISGNRDKSWTARLLQTARDWAGDVPEVRTDEQLVLALQTLSSFDFFGGRESDAIEMLRVVREAVVRYLDDVNPAIRKAAAVTCAVLLDRIVFFCASETEEMMYLEQVLDRLLMLGVGDDSDDIRASVFQSVRLSLDHIISDSENVHCLIEALNDESFEVRAAAMSVLSRVAHYDTLHVMPLVRQTLVKLMRQLQNSKDTHLKQESVQLLQALVRGTNSLIIPYVRPMLEPLIATLNDSHTAVVGAALSTIGELAVVEPDVVREHIGTLFPRLVEALSDQSSVGKQHTAVVALGKLVSSLGMVVEPYVTYPGLFACIVQAIQRSDPPASQLRLEALRTAGLLGAVDSYLFSVHIQHKVSAPETGLAHVEDDVVMEELTELKAEVADDELMSIDKYYLSVCITAVMGVLRDPSLSMHHQQASNVAMRIVRVLREQCVSQLEQIVSGLLVALRRSEGGLKESLFDHVAVLIHVVKRHVRVYAPAIVKVIGECFSSHLEHCMRLLESLCTALPTQDFHESLREVLPCIIQVIRDELLSQDREDNYSRMGGDGQKPLASTCRVLCGLCRMGSHLGEFRRLLIPVLLKVVEQPDAQSEPRRQALFALLYITKFSDDLSEFASRIIHPILNLLIQQEVALHSAALTSLSCMLCRLGPGYVPFIVPARRKTHMLREVLKEQFRAAPQLEEYESLVSRLLKRRPLPPEPAFETELKLGSQDLLLGAKISVDSNSLNMDALERAWTLSGRITESDLSEWMRRISIEVIRQSPSPIIRPCAVLAEVYQPLADALVDAAFVSVWDEMYIYETFDVVDDVLLVKPLETALQATQLPTTIMHTLLNLAEFMDMQDKMLPIDVPLLARAAERAHVLPKALRYREIEFGSVSQSPSSECIESLITINNQLGMRDAAAGMLKYIRESEPTIAISPLWLERLDRWEEALDSYMQTSSQWKSKHPADIPTMHEGWMLAELGRLRCLHALGEYDDLARSAHELKAHLDTEVENSPDDLEGWINEVRCLGAKATWIMEDWDGMEEFVKGDTITHKIPDIYMEKDLSFFSAILAIYRSEYDKALDLVQQMRQAIASPVASLLGDTYNRAYRGMVAVQMLAELEEIVELKRYALYLRRAEQEEGYHSGPATGKRRATRSCLKSTDFTLMVKQKPELSTKLTQLRNKWAKRMKWAPREVDVWRQMLSVHTLVVDPKDDLEPHLQLATLCRKNGMMSLCSNTLKRLGAILPPPSVSELLTMEQPPHPKVVYATYKYMWETGERSKALEELIAFAQRLPTGPQGQTELKVQCLLKSAEWIRQLGQDVEQDRLGEVLDAVNTARELQPNTYRAWHAWALTNYEMSTSLRGITNESGGNRKLNSLVIEAVRGFVKSIALGDGQPVANVLQDTLRLLTVWFEHGKLQGVSEVFDRELDTIGPEKWLGVLPQLIARIHVRNPSVNVLLQRLLCKVAAAHPQALVYPITVALNASSDQRRLVAEAIISELRVHRADLVDEANLVSSELMRVAITSHEQWHEGLEKAAQLYLQEHDVEGMITTLEQLHAEGLGGAGGTVSKGKSGEELEDFVLRNVSFQHCYGRELTEAHEWLIRFKKSRLLADLHQAWDIYHSIFKRVSKQLFSFKRLELRHIAPALTRATDLHLAVPGTYKPNEEIVRIKCFAPSVDVISSKQRPRRMTMIGSDGHHYRFLLKGHEDLRQDERVMQLFGLINALLANDRSTAKRNLEIQRYSVLPLSNNSGVIGWVEECDTLNALIKEYRETREIRTNIETRIMLNKCPEYDKLPVINKVEVFEQVLSETTGHDLAKMLWLKSKNSELWVERRLNYTKSLAVMSMVGYILGLGDRHPSNLMLHRSSGRIVHIDFGDCFEVAMNRLKFPETVPFRLTRMLVNAMEACGIDGTYRSTCEKVMRVLRENKDSVMAMLEAFVHDPLISWRLLAEDNGAPSYNNVADENVMPGPDGVDVVTAVAEAVDEISQGARMNRREEEAVIGSVRSDAHGASRRDSSIFGSARAEELNGRALQVIQRIQTKLTGRDFVLADVPQGVDVSGVEKQVEQLISQARSVENLCQLFVGWCPFW